MLEKIQSDRLAVHVVWTPVLRGDSKEAALQSRHLIPDPRAKHYWDDDQGLGLLYGTIVDLPHGRTLAWDIYFVFEETAEWGEKAPEPAAWAHQLGLGDRHLGDGTKLREATEGALTD